MNSVDIFKNTINCTINCIKGYSMPEHNYVNTHTYQKAFVANQLSQLADLISDQGEVILKEAGLEFPARAVSTVLLIGEQGEVSAADIANTLQQPHQLVTQRIDLLITLGIVERATDPQDGRRKILKLTLKGQDQFSRLGAFLDRASIVFSALFHEIDCDLPSIARKTRKALEQSSLSERMRSLPQTS